MNDLQTSSAKSSLAKRRGGFGGPVQRSGGWRLLRPGLIKWAAIACSALVFQGCRGQGAAGGAEAADSGSVSGLRITKPKAGGTLYLGDTLTIHASGRHAKAILDEVRTVTNRRLTLYLNGIEISGLMAGYVSVPNPKLVVDWNERKQEAAKARNAASDAEEDTRRKKGDSAAKDKAATEAAEKLKNTPADESLHKADSKAKAEDGKARQAVVDAATVEKTKKAEADAADGAVTAARQAIDNSVPEVDLSFVVQRDSDNEVSRKAWDALFRPLNGYKHELSVALAVGGGHPEPAEGPGGRDTVTFQASRVIGWGLVAGLGVLAICVVILLVWPHMLREDGNRDLAFSLGRAQMAFWGVVVISCFAGVAAACGTLEYIPAQVLVLLGISATTALSATIMGSGDPPTPKSQRPHVFGFFDDICVGDRGASFHRVQVVLWTLVLGTYFICNVLQMMSMPVFSDTLLVLMGISSGTYLGFKTQESKFDIAPLEIKGGKLQTMISGGTAPYQWKLDCDPAPTMTPATKSGTQDGTGALALPLTAIGADGHLKLTVTDKAGNSATLTLAVKKLAVADAKKNADRIAATVSGGLAPYRWSLKGAAGAVAVPVVPATGEWTQPGMQETPALNWGANTTLDLEVTDATGAKVSVPGIPT